DRREPMNEQPIGGEHVAEVRLENGGMKVAVLKRDIRAGRQRYRHTQREYVAALAVEERGVFEIQRHIAEGAGIEQIVADALKERHNDPQGRVAVEEGLLESKALAMDVAARRRHAGNGHSRGE